MCMCNTVSMIHACYYVGCDGSIHSAMSGDEGTIVRRLKNKVHVILF